MLKIFILPFFLLRSLSDTCTKHVRVHVFVLHYVHATGDGMHSDKPSIDNIVSFSILHSNVNWDASSETNTPQFIQIIV